MEFIFPSFLWTLGLIAIPIIIHLFFFRRFKKVYFTNVRFLKEIKEETSSRNKLKNLLVLLMRILAFVCLILAFAQPFIPQKTNTIQGNSAVSIFIDNSFSMSALSEDVPLLDLAKLKAREIIAAYSIEDRFQILTHDFAGRQQRLIDQEDALSYLEEITITPSVQNLSNVLAKQSQLLARFNEENKVQYIISDFQKSISDITELRDSTLNLNLIPLQSVQEKNISIDTAWFEAPVVMLNQSNKLLVKLTNYSNEKQENIRLSLNFLGQNKPLGSFDLDPHSSKFDTVNLTILEPGWQTAELRITDYPIQFDDIYKFSFLVDPDVRVLSINQNRQNDFLTAVFTGLQHFSLFNQNVQGINYSTLPEYDLVILNDLNQISTGLSNELSNYIDQGGNVLLFPGLNCNVESYNQFLAQLRANELGKLEQTTKDVSGINTDEFIFNGVFVNQNRAFKLPQVQASYQTTNYQNRTAEVLLTYRDGSNYLSKYHRGNGHLYLCSAPLDENSNNLVRNAEIFVPMLYKMAISTGKIKDIAYFIGKNSKLTLDRNLSSEELVYRMEGPSEFIPKQVSLGNKTVVSLDGEVKEANFYDLKMEEDLIYKIAYNYDRKESDLSYYSISDLKERLDQKTFNIFDNSVKANFTKIIGEREKGIILWRLFLILALIFLALEILLLRIFKN